MVSQTGATRCQPPRPRLDHHPDTPARSVPSCNRDAAQECMSTPLKRSLQNLEFSGTKAAFGTTSSWTCDFSGIQAQRLSAEVPGCGLRRCKVFRADRCRGLSSFHSRPQETDNSTGRLPTRGRMCWSDVVPPAGFEPALPPPETGKTPIMRGYGVSLFRFPCSAWHELLWCRLVHCTNPCMIDDLRRSRTPPSDQLMRGHGLLAGHRRHEHEPA
jgi:hypothetical protein